MATRSSPVRAILGASSAALLLLGAAGIARADATTEADGTRFHLAYDAPASCPDRGAFLTAIRLRTRRPQLAEAGEPALTFAVSVEPRQGSMLGRLEVREPDAGRAPPQKRTVSSGTCAEVTKALALVVALILDPDAETGPEPQLEAPSETPDPPPSAEEPADVGPPVVRPARRPPRERPPPRPQVHRPVELSAGAELAMTGGVGPTIAPKVEGFLDMAFSARHRSGPGLVVAPAFRVGLGFAGTSSDLPVGSHSYWWAGGSARICPIRVALPGTVGLSPCAGMQVGAHHGGTEGVPNGTSSTDIWLAPVAGASLEWVLSSAVTLEFYGGALAPLIRTRFFLAPSTTIFEVPAISGTGAIAARFRFW